MVHAKSSRAAVSPFIATSRAPNPPPHLDAAAGWLGQSGVWLWLRSAEATGLSISLSDMNT